MRIIISAILFLTATLASAQASFDPSTTEFPWKNGPTSDATINLGEAGNSVFVFEAFANFCGACNANVGNVKAMVAEYAEDTQVKFMDLGLDKSDRDYATWIRKHSPNHPVVQDVDKKVWNALSNQNLIPQVFVTDCTGHMLYNHIGSWDNSSKAAIRAAIAQAKETTCD